MMNSALFTFGSQPKHRMYEQSVFSTQHNLTF